jgi:hypothetical protein
MRRAPTWIKSTSMPLALINGKGAIFSHNTMRNRRLTISLIKISLFFLGKI